MLLEMQSEQDKLGHGENDGSNGAPQLIMIIMHAKIADVSITMTTDAPTLEAVMSTVTVCASILATCLYESLDMVSNIFQIFDLIFKYLMSAPWMYSKYVHWSLLI